MDVVTVQEILIVLCALYNKLYLLIGICDKQQTEALWSSKQNQVNNEIIESMMISKP